MCTCPHTCVHTSPSHAYTGLHLQKHHVHIHDTCAHAHTPVCAYTLHTHTHAYACRNSVYISTHMTHTYTGWHRGPGSCWQGHLLVTPPWGGGGNLTGRVPSSGRSPGPHTGLAALPALHHLALPRVLGRARKQSHRSLPSPPTARPCSQRGATGLPSPPGATTTRPAQATCPEAPQPLPEQPAARQGARALPTRVPRRRCWAAWGCRRTPRSRPSERSRRPVPLRSLWKLSVQIGRAHV